MIRDCSGAVWLCPSCHNTKDCADQLATAFELISERLSSIVRLINAQIDVTRSLCRAYGQNIPRSSCCNHAPRICASNDARTFEEEINDMQLEFSKVFNSFVDDTNNLVQTNNNKKRNRTSSFSSSRVTSGRIEKKTRVDASVDTSDLINLTQLVPITRSGNSDSLCHPSTSYAADNNQTSQNNAMNPEIASPQLQRTSPPTPSASGSTVRYTTSNLRSYPPVPVTSSFLTDINNISSSPHTFTAKKFQ
ncbi:uncharacterized protein LOC129761724 [Toxorhynchites rutilus septentrionalis]|uniref:uncharacterized protein LOC129761724 n=1 Tax=Toxorhynchites rutilus septentrionalis TaxID=329112 RepID=UPI00247973B4|nr:uncharacterized protein LOC129761724 [Toxorhynchites rutilus septentrionalis]